VGVHYCPVRPTSLSVQFFWNNSRGDDHLARSATLATARLRRRDHSLARVTSEQALTIAVAA
jgi:hypothetical protein